MYGSSKNFGVAKLERYCPSFTFHELLVVMAITGLLADYSKNAAITNW